jgi:hypothetical protein
MTHILYVSGSDYAATKFDNLYDNRTKASICKTMIAKGICSLERDDFTIDLMSYGEVDSSFISFVREHLQDYDDSKHRDFYEFTDEDLEEVPLINLKEI